MQDLGTEWRTAPGFPDYEVSADGLIGKVETGRLMAASQTQHGHTKISLINETGRHSVSVASLVASAFVSAPNPRCNAVILLNGDLSDVRACNLAWRPYWFAYRYRRQLVTVQPNHFHNLPVRNIDRGIEYPNIIEAGMAEGLLFADLWRATWQGAPVYPNHDRYEVIK
jgi:hypothetical protein